MSEWILNGNKITDTILYLNGEYVKKSEAKISVYDSGFQHGDGVYEGIRAYDNRIFMLKEHIDRLYESCKSLDITVDKTKAELMEIVKETVRRNKAIGVKDIHIRFQITRGLKALTGMNPLNNITGCSIVLCVDEKEPIFNKKGVKLITSIYKRYSPNYLDAKIHDCNQLNQIMAVIEANRQGADEAIMLDENGFVTETNSCTLLMVKDNVLMVPSGDYVLSGITRKLIKEIAIEKGINVIERNISLHEFYNADEVFMCGTVGEIVPVYEIDGKCIGCNDKDSLVEILSREYKSRTESYGVEI